MLTFILLIKALSIFGLFLKSNKVHLFLGIEAQCIFGSYSKPNKDQASFGEKQRFILAGHE